MVYDFRMARRCRHAPRTHIHMHTHTDARIRTHMHIRVHAYQVWFAIVDRHAAADICVAL